jgi:hypothetical protein
LEEAQEEERQKAQFARWIFEVLYSPLKTFQEIVKKPSIKGPLLILIITLPITLAGQYTSGTKFFLEAPTPDDDLWTETPPESLPLLWSSNNNISFDSQDHVFGNYSVSSSLINSTLIQMHLTEIGSFNRSDSGHSQLSFAVKWTNEANATPQTAVLQLFSLNDEDKKFEISIMDTITDSASNWANVSINLFREDWSQSNEPSWAAITGIGFLLTWADFGNITLKIDGLYFGRFAPISSSESFNVQLLYSLMRSSINFFLEWVLLSGIVFLALRSLSGWKGQWKTLLSILGYIYSTSIIYLIALALAFSALPSIFIRYNISYLEYVEAYQSSWGLPISTLSMAFYGWTAILCTIAIKNVQELSWTKAFLMSFGAILMSLILASVLGAFF